MQWWQRYFEASHNSGSAATLYSLLSVFPTTLVAIAYFHSSGGDTNAAANRLITHLKLTGSTASLVRDTFGTVSNNATAATVTVVIGFLFWGLGLGQIYQDLYARAWRIKVGSPTDQGRFAIFFFVVTGFVGLVGVSAAELRSTGWIVLVPVWLVGSTVVWLWVPRFLLHRKIGLRALLPGALLASVVLGGAVGTAPLWVTSLVNSYGNYFGSFGVTVAIIGYAFIMITLSMVCAVFSPVWADWRRTERNRQEQR
jgi:membrane protein